MKAIIMAGGLGTRLRSVLPDLPKPMAPLLGVPVMQRIVELLRNTGVTEICATLQYMPERIISHFGTGEDFGVRIHYRIEEEPLGTAGSVRACEDFYGDRDFLVVSGDAAFDFNLRALQECHKRHKNAVTMALYEYAEPLRYGTVLTDKQGLIKSFIEKPDWDHVVTDRVNTGIYMISPRAMELVPKTGMFDFAKDLFPALLTNCEQLMGLPMDGYWCDIGTPAAYYQCNLDALEGRIKLFGNSATESVRTLEKPEKPAPTQDASRTLIRCGDRARLMRLMSEQLMEAGADFTDGLTINTSQGQAKISPLPGQDAVSISSDKKELRENLAKMASFLSKI